MAEIPINTETLPEREEIKRVTVSNVGAAIFVEEIIVPRTLREAMARQFERIERKTKSWGVARTK